MKVIEESGMMLGEFEEERLFLIEHSDVHKKAGEGVKTVELIYLTHNDSLLFIEAKKTCPNVMNKDETAEKEQKYEEYFTDIANKFTDSIEMYAATALGRNEECTGIGKEIQEKKSYSKTRFKFILIIAEAEEGWLLGPKAELEERLKRLRKIWKADILVLNKRLAKEHGLIK